MGHVLGSGLNPVCYHGTNDPCLAPQLQFTVTAVPAPSDPREVIRSPPCHLHIAGKPGKVRKPCNSCRINPRCEDYTPNVDPLWPVCLAFKLHLVEVNYSLLIASSGYIVCMKGISELVYQVLSLSI